MTRLQDDTLPIKIKDENFKLSGKPKWYQREEKQIYKDTFDLRESLADWLLPRLEKFIEMDHQLHGRSKEWKKDFEKLLFAVYDITEERDNYDVWAAHHKIPKPFDVKHVDAPSLYKFEDIQKNVDAFCNNHRLAPKKLNKKLSKQENALKIEEWVENEANTLKLDRKTKKEWRDCFFNPKLTAWIIDPDDKESLKNDKKNKPIYKKIFQIENDVYKMRTEGFEALSRIWATLWW